VTDPSRLDHDLADIRTSAERAAAAALRHFVMHAAEPRAGPQLLRQREKNRMLDAHARWAATSAPTRGQLDPLAEQARICS
jgi:hypothetical protein